jgi:hypothetical protein
MTKEIELTRGMVALVDDDDFDELNGFLWRACKNGKTWYAIANSGKTTITMHREIMGNPKDLVIDHINCDGLDNRRENLRPCSKQENIQRAGAYKTNSSGYKGVTKTFLSKKYSARIKVNNKHFHLGCYNSLEDAARAYDEAAKKYHGKFAFLNFPETL